MGRRRTVAVGEVAQGLTVVGLEGQAGLPGEEVEGLAGRVWFAVVGLTTSCDVPAMADYFRAS